MITYVTTGPTCYDWQPVLGCDRISPGCDHCVDMADAANLKAAGHELFQHDGHPVTSGPGFGMTLHTHLLTLPLTYEEPTNFFLGVGMDLFHARIPFPYLKGIFEVIAACPRHTFHFCTRRSLRMARLAPKLPWPDNLWTGVSVENADYLNRLDHLRQVPAAIRWLAAEPLIGPLDGLNLDGIDTVSVLGEFGEGHRPIEQAWVRDIRDACIARRVPFYLKGWGGPVNNPIALLDGRLWRQLPRHPARPGRLLPDTLGRELWTGEPAPTATQKAG
ncbi:DUF5131 family protein [Parafrankia sp. FMc2]|uniref:DUF5131 family protein n=1 Tax=Parafrankia sp. FMc2 TaxID=3233196 RepID=UPI0034D60D5E